MELTSFKINRLHGRKTILLKFTNNRLIIVGENGAGKTTILRMLFLFISGQWSGLAKYNFSSISLRLGERTISLPRDVIAKRLPLANRKFLNRLPPEISNRIRVMLSQEGDIDIGEMDFLCEKYGIPFSAIMHEVSKQSSLFDSGDLASDINTEINSLRDLTADSQILYLPTYRRIEQELRNILTDFDTDDFKRSQRRRLHPFRNKDKQAHTELVQFGMNDVKVAINKKLEYLKDFTRSKLNSLTLAYLGDVVDKKYDTVDVEEIKSVEDETVRNILERIDSKILAKGSKEHLTETINKVKNNDSIDEHQKVICHYFSKLLSFQQELEREEQGIRSFCDVCNGYMADKRLEYTSSSFSFEVTGARHPNGIELSQLSSGEKQIVSLFSHLYLSENVKFFVMIDEPELSLSVPWQRKFLQDISQSDFCSGFLAVTHSPFIYDNNLEKYAHGLEEFTKEAS